MRVLLTGAAGLIGMALRPALTARGHSVLATDIVGFGKDDPELRLMRLDDRAQLEHAVASGQIEAIIHCGAISGPMMARGQPMSLVAANIDTTALLLDIARAHGLKRVVFCSSISVYGDVGAAVITEATPLRPTSVYGATKVACEQLIRGFAAEYGLSGVSLRIGRVYGPYRRANCHLKTMIQDAERQAETEIPCDPGFVYHYVYVDDVAAAVITALEAVELPHREYNVGSGEALTMPEIVTAAERVLPGLRARLVAGADDVPDVQISFDVARIAGDLGWTPRFSIADGLAAYRAAIRAGAAAP
ncbi:NAD-dependent epimerase/dehydratase family protein [Bradyrhizobium sp. HKCCYLS2038]|uniref:NAD-dependent epimerase/dehydratase family protein n=1 Tax=unclassified Bradyrhizobium TaxID=2631580 RepID=UPI003EB9E66D